MDRVAVQSLQIMDVILLLGGRSPAALSAMLTPRNIHVQRAVAGGSHARL
jgi:hypothetical protein